MKLRQSNPLLWGWPAAAYVGEEEYDQSSEVESAIEAVGERTEVAHNPPNLRKFG